ncbi:MAG: prenyltransferase [Spirochaetales bacterium]|nr:prenyltransferase [Spirochaetales bacterium]
MGLIGTLRLPFVILTPACVVLGIATALSSGGTPRWWEVLLVTVGAILTHLVVNILNEYQDHKSGLDSKTHRTPFSGGSGSLQENPQLAPRALFLGLATAAAAAGIGIYFVVTGSPLLLVFGAVGLLAALFYTPWIAKQPLICLIAPGLGFGTCMVIGTHLALGGSLTWATVIASFIPFFLVSNLLLINQFPDVEADRQVGRKNIVITAGYRTGAMVYGLFLLLTYAAIAIGVITRQFPLWSLLGLLTLPAAAKTFLGALKNGNNTEKLISDLGLNVIIVLLTPVLTAIGIFTG